MRFVLASASPRRRELLEAAGFAFDVDAEPVDERLLPSEDPAVYAARVAVAKARGVAPRHPGRPVLSADTIVLVDGEVLGKPVDGADARRMLTALAGRAHEVLTAVALCAGDRTFEALARTSVWMRPLTAGEIAGYVASGEPMDKAGAYAIQGLASRFITRIDGSYTNVVGLPVGVVDDLLSQL
jgi:septum formation protein